MLLVMTLPASKEVALWQNCLSKNLHDDQNVLIILDPGGAYGSVEELELNFYNTKKINIKSVKNKIEIHDLISENPEKKYFFASRKTDRTSNLIKANLPNKLLCSALPDWLTAININNWTARASLWRVWSLQN